MTPVLNSTCTNWLISFAQWQYRSLWGLSEARLLLIENYTQYPALTAWNMAAVQFLWASTEAVDLTIIHNAQIACPTTQSIKTLIYRQMHAKWEDSNS